MSGLDEQGWKDKNWLIAAFWEDKTELFQGPSFFGGTVHRYYLKTYFGMMSSMTSTFCRISLRNSNFLRFWWMCECAYKERLKAKWYDTGNRLLLCKMRSRYQHSWQNHKIWVTCHLFTWETWRCSIRSNVSWWRDDHFRVRSLQLFVFGSNFAGDCVRKMGT